MLTFFFGLLPESSNFHGAFTEPSRSLHAAYRTIKGSVGVGTSSAGRCMRLVDAPLLAHAAARHGLPKPAAQPRDLAAHQQIELALLLQGLEVVDVKLAVAEDRVPVEIAPAARVVEKAATYVFSNSELERVFSNYYIFLLVTFF